jgi:hypothetical protein
MLFRLTSKSVMLFLRNDLAWRYVAIPFGMPVLIVYSQSNKSFMAMSQFSNYETTTYQEVH